MTTEMSEFADTSRRPASAKPRPTPGKVGDIGHARLTTGEQGPQPTPPTPLTGLQNATRRPQRPSQWRQTIPHPGLMSDSARLDQCETPEQSEFADTPHGPVSAKHEHVWLPVLTERVNHQRGYTEYKTYLCACGKAVGKEHQ